MPAIASRISRHWLDVAWGAFAAVNIAVMLRWHDWQTVPFHFVWVSLTVLYGFRTWRGRTTAIVLSVVFVTTGYALLRTTQITGEGLDEMTEVPLMLAMFLAMMWHAHRRDTALAQVERSAAREHEFIRDASHLLRTPITIARGHAELVAGRATGQTRSDADVIVEELQRLSSISNRLLVLAAADDPRFTCVRPIDLAALIERTAARWAAAAPRHVVADVRATGTLEADEERLICALDALIENAVKATHEGDEVIVRVRASGTTAVIEVADRGAGIPAETLPEVFDRFARRPHQAGGTGLGLAIVQAIAASHGGVATITSTPADGTCAALRLPGYTPRDGVREDAGRALAPDLIR